MKVIADLTSPVACATAAGISAGEGGVNSTLPYLTNVANRGREYSANVDLNNLKTTVLEFQ